MTLNKNKMKAKLLRKIRSRYIMEYNPNKKKYPYKLVLRWEKFNNNTICKTYKSKSEMFDEYRKSVITYCGILYGCYKQPKNVKPIELIEHCK